MFTPVTAEAIKSYVYALTDDDNRIFYVGKGTGNRVFTHVEEVRQLLAVDPNQLLQKQDDDDAQQDGLSDKRQSIANILRAKKLPGMYIVREGLTPEQALLVEAVLISVLDWQFSGTLTNEVGGHGTSHFGLKTVAELEATKGQPFLVSMLPNLIPGSEVIAINVNRRWGEVANGKSTLLDISRGVWKLSGRRAAKCPYAIIHSNGIVRGVFEIEEWLGPDAVGRFTFKAVGSAPLAGPDFKDKNASSLFGATGSGSQNPIRYIQVPA